MKKRPGEGKRDETERFASALETVFAERRFLLPGETAKKMSAYFEALLAENKKWNLTRITDPAAAAEKHFYDSVAPVAAIAKGAKVLDVGSGGGFPIMPLKAVREDIHACAIEASRKKCIFMRGASQCAKIDVDVICGRAEELAHDQAFRGSFDVCVSRAVAPLSQLLEITAPFVVAGGLVLAYKGAYAAELAEAEDAITALGLELGEKIHTGRGKTVLVFHKIKETEDLYPRKYTKISKKPL